MRFGPAVSKAAPHDPWRDVIRLRHELHRHAELSHHEEQTARMIADWFYTLDPDAAFLEVGGHGLAFVFEGKAPGKTLLFRAELDALPIAEVNFFQHRSLNDHVSHMCGHDGHMAILAGLGSRLAETRPLSGRVVLLFQPAELVGEGAGRVLGDEKFRRLKPDLVFAIHNLPKYPRGQVLLRAGTFNCASVGMVARLGGKAAHAAYPEHGQSPAAAVSEILPRLAELPQSRELAGVKAMVTVTHARIGDATLGVAPGYAEIQTVLRAESDDHLARIAEVASLVVRSAARERGLSCEVTWREKFHANLSDSGAVEIVRRAAESLEYPIADLPEPLRWSEDFSDFTSRFRGTMLGLGAGETHPQLHSPDYDFPDQLVPLGVELLAEIVEGLLNS